MCTWTCSTYGGGERCIQGFGGKPDGKRTFEDTGVYGGILTCIFRNWDVGVWTSLAQGMGGWWAVANAVINFRVP